MTDTDDTLIEAACIVLHNAYEAAAALEGWETQARSRKVWSEVPDANKATMRRAVSALLDHLTGPEAYVPEVAGTLLWLLRRMGDEWGPLGVLKTAAQLWPDAAAVLHLRGTDNAAVWEQGYAQATRDAAAGGLGAVVPRNPYTPHPMEAPRV